MNDTLFREANGYNNLSARVNKRTAVFLSSCTVQFLLFNLSKFVFILHLTSYVVWFD